MKDYKLNDHHYQESVNESEKSVLPQVIALVVMVVLVTLSHLAMGIY